MISILVLILILIGLVIHRYLNIFWENGELPYPSGFTLFSTLFIVIYLVDYIWLFGFLIGIIVFLLTLFQIIFSSYLWPFLLPSLINIHKKPSALLYLDPPKVNLFIYGLWSFIIITLGGLTILNFFIIDYEYLLTKIESLFTRNYNTLIILIIGSIALGNLVRMIFMKILSNHKSG